MKTMHLNLATLTEQELIRILEKNKSDLDEMLTLMSMFFELFSTAAHFSRVLQDYAERQHPDFSVQFQNSGVEQHNIKAKDLLQFLTKPNSAYVH